MSSRLVRIYPIRTTRNSWNIPLFCYHRCGDTCRTRLVDDSDNPDQLILMENPDYRDGRCSCENTLERTYIRLTTFFMDNPVGWCSGPLYDPIMKVIPDNTFSITIFYPLSQKFEVTISAPAVDGFTLIELLSSIKMLYEFIYREEELTAPPQLYKLKRVCSICGIKNLSDYVKDSESPINDCCICYTGYDTEHKAGKLQCEHVFHNECVKEWLNTSKTCPLCRSHIFTCENCDGLGIVHYDFRCIVIPLERRGSMLNRNRTYGIFGIHSYDLEDLIIERLSYDRLSKRLYMEISS